MLTPLVVAFSTLIDEHQPIDGGETEQFECSLTFAHDTESDMLSLDAQFNPPLEQYESLVQMPDSYQMMHLIIQQFIEGVGIASEELEGMDEDLFVSTAAPAPRLN